MIFIYLLYVSYLEGRKQTTGRFYRWKNIWHIDLAKEVTDKNM